ncbi:MAG: isoprenylcysteine carboxylmethyltransferase family protein [Veillonellales bacterium]
MVKAIIFILAAIIICQRAVELYIANRNRKAVIKLGALEYGAGHYYMFFILHTSWILGWILECYVNGWTINRYWYIWGILLINAQILRYWCIISLGNYWNTRILVIPGNKPLRTGPYRFVKHPNYIAVAIEMLSIPLLCNAIFTAVLASLCNALLLLCIRIPEEEKAVYKTN